MNIKRSMNLVEFGQNCVDDVDDDNDSSDDDNNHDDDIRKCKTTHS